jgi:F0F1-type ATP synthase delta subunit
MVCKDIDTEFALFKSMVPVIESVNGYISGTMAASFVERKIRAALKRANVQGGEIACRTIALMVKKGLFKYAPALVDQIGAKIDHRNGMVRVNVETALPLNAISRERLLSAVMQRTGAKTVCFSETTRPELLGGYRLVLGNVVVDASLSTLLRDMEKKLSTGECI